MATSRAEEFSALDEQFVGAVRSDRGSRRTPTRVVVGDGDPVDLPIGLVAAACQVVPTWGAPEGAALDIFATVRPIRGVSCT